MGNHFYVLLGGGGGQMDRKPADAHKYPVQDTTCYKKQIAMHRGSKTEIFILKRLPHKISQLDVGNQPTEVTESRICFNPEECAAYLEKDSRHYGWQEVIIANLLCM